MSIDWVELSKIVADALFQAVIAAFTVVVTYNFATKQEKGKWQQELDVRMREADEEKHRLVVEKRLSALWSIYDRHWSIFRLANRPEFTDMQTELERIELVSLIRKGSFYFRERIDLIQLILADLNTLVQVVNLVDQSTKSIIEERKRKVQEIIPRLERAITIFEDELAK